jgi:hypothetical protein
MPTLKQKLGHALIHFTFVYLMVQGMKVFMPASDFFRRLWWKAWGHDPKQDVNFHLSQIKFDHHFANRVLISSSVHGLAVYLYGENNLEDSKAYLQMHQYLTFKYQPYDVHEAISDLWVSEAVGVAILNWFKKVDGFSQERLDSVRAFSPAFEEFYSKLLVKELHKPKEEAPAE